jgi:hypothetical protein
VRPRRTVHQHPGLVLPAWLLCIVAGIALTSVARQVLVATGMTLIAPAGARYPSLACLLTFATWLIVFAS